MQHSIFIHLFPDNLFARATVAGAHLWGVCAQVQRVRLVGFITEPATVRQILEHVGEPTNAPAIAPVRSPPLEMKNGQELAAVVAVFEAIHELEFDQTANLRARTRHDRLLHDAGILQSRFRKWSLTRHWGDNPAL